MDAIPGGKPATLFFLTVEGGRLWVKYGGTSGGEITRRVHSMQDWIDFITSKAHEARVPIEDLIIQGSSSLNWPEEEGATPETIELVKELWWSG